MGSPDWPQVLFSLVVREYQNQKQQRIHYDGEALLVDKDDKDHTTAAVDSEKDVTRRLFKLCRETTRGCFTIGNEPYWLVNYEVPNFGKRSKQCADLVGISSSGGLVVFECKIAINDYAPVTSALEGLDYLTCLTAEPNFSRFQQEFQRWKSKSNQIIPTGFENTDPVSSASHEVIVLGPAEYYDKFRRVERGDEARRTLRGLGWEFFADNCTDQQTGLRLGFAVSDFSSPAAEWLSSR